MLVAKLEDTYCVATRTSKKHLDYRCPVCKTRVVLKNGSKMIPHFAHQTKQTCLASEGESLEHLAGKLLLHAFFPQFELEVYLPDLQQRPDLLWEKHVLEFQCSPLSHPRFLERTLGYSISGYQSIWIFGQALQPKHHLTQLQRACLQYDLKKGFYLYGLDVAQQEFLIFQYLHWSYEVGLTYQTVCTTLSRKKEYSSYTSQKNTKDYRQWLKQQLAIKRPEIMRVQAKCYLEQGHLVYLPEWMYRASEYGVLFKHDNLYYRYIYQQCPSYFAWRQKMENEHLDWPFPYLDKEQIYREFYLECSRYSKGVFHDEWDNSMLK